MAQPLGFWGGLLFAWVSCNVSSERSSLKRDEALETKHCDLPRSVSQDDSSLELGAGRGLGPLPLLPSESPLYKEPDLYPAKEPRSISSL